MKWPFRRKRPKVNPHRKIDYFISYRMLTGGGRLEAHSNLELSRALTAIRLAGASDITVVDSDGNLVVFDPGT